MLFSLAKRGNVLKMILRYIAEVTIIFLGITISFLFEQWREEQRQKKDLIELSESLLRDIDSFKTKLSGDLAGSTQWIRELDSLRVQRTSNRTSEPQLNFLNVLITGQLIFLFDPYSPTYSSATISGLANELPDTIRNQLYRLYQVELPLFQLVYDQQQENITHFRNNTMVPATTYLYEDKDGSPVRLHFQKFAQEVQRPVYGNFINQTIVLEKKVYQINESISGSLAALEASLRKYLKELKE